VKHKIRQIRIACIHPSMRNDALQMQLAELRWATPKKNCFIRTLLCWRNFKTEDALSGVHNYWAIKKLLD